MNATELFRVVGVRADKNRVVICDGATGVQAAHARAYLLESHTFLGVEIEPDCETTESGESLSRPRGVSDDSRKKPMLGERLCPSCQRPYIPTAAKYAYRQRNESDGSAGEDRRLESITYFGECPSGHTVRDIVEV
jgi:hypothetical protein